MKEYIDEKGKKYKVTRRIPELSISEIKVYREKARAMELFNEWLK